jgi:hypothetical protein
MFLPICALLSAVVAAALRRFRPAWSRRRVDLVAAAPIPGMLIALCLWIFISAATTPREQCGVDACGMAMAAAMMVGFAALCAFAFGLVVAALVQWLMRRR